MKECNTDEELKAEVESFVKDINDYMETEFAKIYRNKGGFIHVKFKMIEDTFTFGLKNRMLWDNNRARLYTPASWLSLDRENNRILVSSPHGDVSFDIALMELKYDYNWEAISWNTKLS